MVQFNPSFSAAAAANPRFGTTWCVGKTKVDDAQRANKLTYKTRDGEVLIVDTDAEELPGSLVAIADKTPADQKKLKALVTALDRRRTAEAASESPSPSETNQQKLETAKKAYLKKLVAFGEGALDQLA